MHCDCCCCLTFVETITITATVSSSHERSHATATDRHYHHHMQQHAGYNDCWMNDRFNIIQGCDSDTSCSCRAYTYADQSNTVNALVTRALRNATRLVTPDLECPSKRGVSLHITPHLSAHNSHAASKCCTRMCPVADIHVLCVMYRK